MGPDPARPDPSILLTRSKKEALTRVLFDQTRRDFFIQREKIDIFREKFSKPKP